MTITETIKHLEMIRQLSGDLDVVALEFQEDGSVVAIDYEFHTIRLEKEDGTSEELCAFLDPEEFEEDSEVVDADSPKKEPHLKIIR